VRTSPFRNAAYSLRRKIEKFEAIIFPRRSRRRCLRTADRCAPVPEAVAVHPKCAMSSSGAHVRLLAQRQTPLVAQPSRRHTAAARDPPHVPLRCVVDGSTAIVSIEQDGV
jgi:hypothetical protein